MTHAKRMIATPMLPMVELQKAACMDTASALLPSGQRNDTHLNRLQTAKDP